MWAGTGCRRKTAPERCSSVLTALFSSRRLALSGKTMTLCQSPPSSLQDVYQWRLSHHGTARQTRQRETGVRPVPQDLGCSDPCYAQGTGLDTTRRGGPTRIHLSAWQGYEAGRLGMSRPSLIRVARVLGLPASKLLALVESEEVVAQNAAEPSSHGSKVIAKPAARARPG